ncbi:hypothetical protein EJ06DRAFT_113644 [Trichodelitschia bisporula]|uniref:Rhodopsin domain-containing protein n=1 Tax=Trichodelitschia bisporula TaxID=703511 RepID=A0A6G1HR42_9PEZI|nr:hypothetical protein EJ06DRAFT_113644 [Trichodelitschia bisporula]
MGESRAAEVAGTTILFLVLCWLTFVLRVWVRMRMINAFSLDDWLIGASLALFTAYSAMTFIGLHWGVGLHAEELTARQRVNAMKAWYFGELFYILNTTVLRLAVGIFLLRLALRRPHRHILYALNATNILFNAYYLIFTIFQCTPIKTYWLRLGSPADQARAAHGVCHAHIGIASTYAQSAVSAVLDWAFAIIPGIIVWDLQLSRRRKIPLVMILSVGAVASAATIIRIPYIHTLSASHDFLWDTVDVIIWSSAEPGLGIAAVSSAALKPLLMQMLCCMGFDIPACSGGKPSTAMQLPAPVPGPKNNWVKEEWPKERKWEGDNVPLQGMGGKMGTSVTVQGGARDSSFELRPEREESGEGVQVTRTMDVKRETLEGEEGGDFGGARVLESRESLARLVER